MLEPNHTAIRTPEEETCAQIREAVCDEMPGGVVRCRLGARPRILGGNAQFRAMFGTLDEHGVGRGILPEDRERAMTELLARAGRREPVSLEFRMQAHSGQRLWVHCVGKCVAEEDGEPVYQLLLLDVTDRVLSRQRQDRDRLRYEAAVEREADTVFSYNPEEDRIWLQTTGVGREVEVEHYLRDLERNRFVHPQGREAMRRLLLGECGAAELQMRPTEEAPDYHWYLCQGNAVRPGGRLRLVVGSFRDIQELRRQESRLERDLARARQESRDMNRRFVQAVSGLYEAIYEADLDTGRIAVWKAAAETLCPVESGADFRAYLERVCREEIHPDYRAAYQERFLNGSLERAVEQQGPLPALECPRLCAGGEYRWFSLQVQRLEGPESERRVMLYLRDIHAEREEQERQQQTLRDALRMAEQASAAKSDFLSRMSHDIRTPMNAIIGMTAIAQANLDNAQRIADCLEKIGMSSRYLLSLINDILDMSRIESGKLSLNLAPFDLCQLVQNITDLCSGQARQRRQDFNVLVDESVEHTYIGDTLRLNQVLMNLLSNALKYTPEGGRVRLSVRSVRQSGTRCVLEFEVSDNGMGMSEEFLSRIFEPFEQERHDTGRTFEGTGLGLAITHSLVSLMDGHIAVRSRKGEGSTFTVEIPLTRVDGAQPEGRPLREGLRVLVVDDDRDVCIYTAQLLEHMGAKPRWVLSGREAVEQVRAALDRGEGYDAVLVDWRMPEVDGVETARRIRACVGHSALVIAMSAYDWSDIETEARAAGVDLFLAKPVFPHNLRSALTSTTQTRPEPEEEVLPDFSGERVLLVEDNALNLEIAQSLLEMEGLVVDTAENGQIAVDKFTAAPAGCYRAVLMDIRMPVMDGLEASRRIRAGSNPDGATVPIIAMTANAFQNEEYEARAAGIDGYLTKPVDPGQLFATLARALRGKEEDRREG